MKFEKNVGCKVLLTINLFSYTLDEIDAREYRNVDPTSIHISVFYYAQLTVRTKTENLNFI